MRHSHLPSVLCSRLSRDTPYLGVHGALRGALYMRGGRHHTILETYPSSSSASASCSRASWCASTSAGSAPLTRAHTHTALTLSMAICLCVPMGTCLTPSGRTPCHESRSRKGESPEGREAPRVFAAAVGVARTSGGVRGRASCISPRVEVRLIAAAAAAGPAAGAVTAAVTEVVTVGLGAMTAGVGAMTAGAGAMTAGVGAMIDRQRWRALATTSVHDL